MGSFPLSVTPPGAGISGLAGPAGPGAAAPAPAPTGGGNANPLIQLATLTQVVSSIAKSIPNSDQALKMVLDGIRGLQAAASAQSVPAQSATPPV